EPGLRLRWLVRICERIAPVSGSIWFLKVVASVTVLLGEVLGSGISINEKADAVLLICSNRRPRSAQKPCRIIFMFRVIPSPFCASRLKQNQDSDNIRPSGAAAARLESRANRC
ncbi:MAG: hypothetical protein PVI70_16785, partial [Gammaproteobacteria bacterium]